MNISKEMLNRIYELSAKLYAAREVKRYSTEDNKDIFDKAKQFVLDFEDWKYDN